MKIELATVDACEGCGKCCMNIGLPPFEVPNPDLGVIPKSLHRFEYDKAFAQDVLDTELFMDMPEELRASHAKLIESTTVHPGRVPCAWLDLETKKCRHYEWRPAVCRDWIPGDEGCNRARFHESVVVWRGDDTTDEEWWNPKLPNKDEPEKIHPDWAFLDKSWPIHDFFSRLWRKMTSLVCQHDEEDCLADDSVTEEMPCPI